MKDFFDKWGLLIFFIVFTLILFTWAYIKTDFEDISIYGSDISLKDIPTDDLLQELKSRTESK